MADLASLTAAGRSDILEGWVLSPFRLQHFGQMELEWEARHLLAAARAAEQASDRIAEKLLAAATNDVAAGKLAYGSPHFDRKCLAASNVPFLLWLSLQPKHPQATREQAAALVTPENERQLRGALLELAGFDLRPRPKARPAVPPNWQQIFHALTKNGHGPAEWSQWTTEQLLNALAAGAASTDAFATPEEQDQARRKSAAAIFADLMRAEGITREQLSGMSADELAPLVKRISPRVPVQAEYLLKARDEYLAAPPEPAPADPAAQAA